MPEKWNPSRFLEEGSKSIDLQRTMAFGGGKRACAGSLQAMLITCTAVGRFIQEFSWRLKEGQEGDADTVQLTSVKLQPLEAYLSPRSLVA